MEIQRFSTKTVTNIYSHMNFCTFSLISSINFSASDLWIEGSFNLDGNIEGCSGTTPSLCALCL